MKYNIYILLIIGCFGVIQPIFGQNDWQVCPPNGITTNPNAPVNNQSTDSYFENDFFDWRLNNDLQQYFHPNWSASIVPGFPTINPFWSSDPTMDYLSGYSTQDDLTIDYAPEEGWELIGRNLGLDRNGDEDPELFPLVYFVLYNKYTGKLRYFFAINPAARDAGAQSYEVEFKFTDQNNSSNPNVNGLFGVNGNLSQPLDQKTEITFVKAYNKNNFWWNVADFVVGYDPCTCIKNNEGDQFNPTMLSLIPTTITQGDIEMSGRLIGTVADPYFNNPSKYNGNELLSVYDNGHNVSTVGVETFKALNEIELKVHNFEEDLNNYNQSGKPAFNAFIDLLSTAVSAFPVAEAAINYKQRLKSSKEKDKELLKLIGASSKFATGLLNKFEEPSKKTLPSIMDGEIALVGSQTTTKSIDNAEIIYETPGTGSPNNQEELGGTFSAPAYPMYNEVLGQFALLKTPKVDRGTHEFDNDEFDNVVYDVFKLDETTLEYLMNPALDIDYENTTILASLIFDVDRHFDGSVNPPPLAVGASHIYDTDLNKNVYFSPFLPLECLGNTTIQLLNNFDTEETNYDGIYVQNVYLRLMIFYQFNSLNRNGNPNANILTLTYPVDVPLQETPGTLVNGLSNVTATKILNTTNFTTSQDVQAFNTITVTGNLTASPGVIINLVANEVILKNGATLGPGINIRLGMPTACGNPISQFPIANLGAYCTTGAYKANTLRNAPIVEEVKKEELPSIMFFTTPNPFIESTNLRFDIMTDDEISIVVYDILGQEVATVLQPTALSAGSYAYTLDGSNLSTGVYLATIQSHSEAQLRQTIKIVKQ